MIDDIESTIRFTIDKDHLRQQVADAIKEAGQMAGDAFIDALRGGGGGRGGARGGGRTRSSADPDVTADVRGDTGGGAPSGAPASGGRRGGGGGNVKTPNDAQADVGTGDAPRRHGPTPRDWYGKFLKSGEMDYRQYMSGQAYSSDARTLVGGLMRGPGGLAAGATTMLTSHMGSALINAAKERAEYIDSLKGTGIEPPGMGLLRYANPMASALTAAGAGLVNWAGAGLSMNDKYTGIKAGLRFSEAEASRLGVSEMVSSPAYFNRAARNEFGALSGEEAEEARRAYLSTRTHGRSSMAPEAFLRGRGAGVDSGSLAAFGQVSLMEAEGSDPSRLIAAGQQAGLNTAAIGGMLRQIAENTKSVASKGIKVDTESATQWLEKVIDSGRSPVLGAMAYQNMTSAAGAPLEQLMQIPRSIAEAASWQEVVSDPMSRGGDISGMLKAAANVYANPDRILLRTDPNTEWGKLAAIGMTGQLGMEGIAQRATPSWSGKDVKPLSEETAGGMYDPFWYAQLKMSREATRLGMIADIGQFMHLQKPGWFMDKSEMRGAATIGDLAGGFSEAVLAPLKGSLDAQNTTNESLKSAIERLTVILSRME